MELKKKYETKCEDCRNDNCSQAGEPNPFMVGKNICSGYCSDDLNAGEERDFVEEHYEYMKRRVEV